MLIEITTNGWLAEPVRWQTRTFCPAVLWLEADADECTDACVDAWLVEWLELEWPTVAWLECCAEPVCFKWPFALPDLACDAAFGCARWPGCF
jgi:hypothetical protein